MRTRQVVLLCGLVLLLGQSVSASTITWNAPENITGASNVQTGNILEAYIFGNSSVTATTINGVTFSPFDVSLASSITVGNVTLSTSGGDGIVGTAGLNTFGSGSAPFADLPLAYQSLLGTAAYTNCNSCTAPLDVELSGLTIGGTYEVEVWVNDSRSDPGSYRNETLSGAPPPTLDFNTTGDGGVGQYVIGTFTAGATTESFAILGTDSYDPNSASQINGLEVLATPEPSTLALLGLGALALAFAFRGKRQSGPARSA